MKNIYVIPTDKPSRLFKIKEILVFDRVNKIYSEYYKNLHKYTNHNIYITSNEEIKEGDWVYYLHNLGSYKPFIQKVVKPNYSDYKPYSIHFTSGFGVQEDCKKIILTTDQDLIKDGVQAIDDEFLEWFVKNPNCEKVDIIENKYLICNHCDSLYSSFNDGTHCDVCVKISKPILKTIDYTIIISKEEPFKHSIKVLTTEEVMKGRSSAYEFIDFYKQETLEEAAEKLYREYPNNPLNKPEWHYNKDVNCFKKRKAFINGAKWQAKRMYSEQEVFNLIMDFHMEKRPEYKTNPVCVSSWFEQFKKK